jgi:hypothetical protein
MFAAALVALAVFSVAACSSATSGGLTTKTTWDTSSGTAPKCMTGLSLKPDLAPEGRLMTEIEMALPCNFSGSAVVPAGSYHYVVYLAPLNVHTRAVFESILARNPDVTSVPGVSFTVAAGKQSFAEGDAESGQLASKSKSKCLGYGVNADGSVTISPTGAPGCPHLRAASTTTSIAPSVALAGLISDCQALMRTRTYRAWRATGVVPVIGSDDPGLWGVLADLGADAGVAQGNGGAGARNLQFLMQRAEAAFQSHQPIDLTDIMSTITAVPTIRSSSCR